jgi:hypothetical protein
MKNLIIILFFSVSQICVSQVEAKDSAEKTTQTGLSSEEVEQFKIDYAVMTKSDTYKAMKGNRTEFTKKLNGQKDAVLKPDEGWNTWITNNLSKTNFSSIEEANSMRQSGIDLTKKNMDEFPELYATFRRATKEQRQEILKAEQDAKSQR